MATPERTLPPAAISPRARTVQIGTAFAMAGVVMYFAGLVGMYLRARADFRRAGLEWIPESVDVQLTAPTIILWTFIISLPVAHWAHYSIRNDDRPHAYMALGLTIVLGLMTINQAAFNFNAMSLVLGGSRAETMILLVAGSHMALTVVGLLFFVVVAFRALTGQFTSRYTDGIAAAIMFWYVVTVLYLVVWLLIYVSK